LKTKRRKELYRALKARDLQPDRAPVWLNRQHKLEEATALSFSVNRFDCDCQKVAGGRKPPAETIAERQPFLRLRQQTRQEALTTSFYLSGSEFA
jgi:hypothetical protein